MITTKTKVSYADGSVEDVILPQRLGLIKLVLGPNAKNSSHVLERRGLTTASLQIIGIRHTVSSYIQSSRRSVPGTTGLNAINLSNVLVMAWRPPPSTTGGHSL